MNAKQRMLDALNLKRPAELPVAPCYPCLYLEDYTHRYYKDQYMRLLRGRPSMDLDHATDTQMRAEALYKAYNIFEHKMDWMEVYYGPAKSWVDDTAIECQGDDLVYLDKVTGERYATDKESRRPSSMSYVGLGRAQEDTWDLSDLFQSAEAVDDLVRIVKAEELLDWGVFDLAKQVVEDYGDRFFISCITDVPFISTYSILGFQGMMLMMMDRPKVFHHLLERRLEQYIEIIKGFARVGVHGAWVQDCLSSAELISPEQFDTFVFPTERDFIAEVKASGIIPMLYYCGHVMPRLPRLKESGAQVIAVEESKKDFIIEIEDVVKAVGDEMCIFGNIDTIAVVSEGNPAIIEKEVARQLAAGAKARSFVVGTGSPFPLETNPRHIDALVESARRLGPKYFG